MDNPTTQSNSSKYLLLFFSFIVLFLLLLHIFLLFLPNKDSLTVVSKTLYTVGSFFILGLVAIVLMKMKSSSSETKSGSSSIAAFLQVFNGNLALLIGYVISLVILFTTLSSETIDKYSIYILLATVIPGIFVFYKNIVQQSSVVYTDEKIRFIITVISFILTFILFYNADPGGYIHDYFGATMLFTILLAVFGTLYILTIFALPDKNKSGKTPDNFFEDFKNKGFTSPSVLFTLAFVLYLIIITIGISIYPGGIKGFFQEKTFENVWILISIFSVFVLSIAFFMYNFNFFGKTTGITEGDKINSIFKNALLFVFGLAFSGVLIAWLLHIITSLSSSSGIFSFILNLLLIISVLSLVYKLIVGTSLYKQPFFKLIINIIFYIPCLFVGLIEGILWFFGGLSKLFGFTKAIQMTDGKTDKTAIVILIVTILLFLIYLFRPSIEKQIFKQGGKLLVNKPISTNVSTPVSDYLTLNEPLKTFDYRYGLSFWFYIDAYGTNTNSSYNYYASLLNYGGKPSVLYNASTNKLIITMKTNNDALSQKINKTDTENYDDNGNLIVYTKPNILLQRWNHVVFNYNGGTLDIFYNGKLEKSVYGVIPYMEYDALIAGQDSGVYGRLCNLNYFNEPLNLSQIYYLYEFVKNKDPPISYDNEQNLIKEPKVSPYVTSSFDVSRKKIGEDVNNNVILREPKAKITPLDNDNYLSLKWYFAQQGDDVGMP